MNKVLFVTIAATVLATCWAAAPTDYCTPFSATPVKKLPQLPKDTFQVGFEANMLEKGYTVSGFEVYDGPNRKGLLQMTAKGSTVSMVYNYPTNELLTVVYDVACISTPLNESEGKFFFGANVDKVGQVQMMSIQQVLHLEDDTNEQYMGYATERGISVERWDACVTWPELNAQMLVSYYFTADNWTTHTLDRNVPVRAVVKGRVNNGTAVYDIEHHYEFSGFSANINDTRGSSIPGPGVFCVGRKKTKPVPQVPTHFSFNSEVLNDNFMILSNIREVYDMTTKLARIDFKPLGIGDTQFAANPLRQIDDFGNGIRYTIDRVYGNCTVQQIDGTGFDAVPIGSGLVTMRNNTQFFFLDDSYVYIGRNKMRDLDTETWQSWRTDYPPKAPTNSTFEWSFLAQEWQDGSGSVWEQGGVPVRLYINMLQYGLTVHYNFYNFNNETPAIDQFDVGACFKDAQKRRFRLTFNGEFDQVVSVGTELFKYEAYGVLSALMFISPLRISEFRVLNPPSKFFVYFSVLDRPPVQGDVQANPEQPLDVAIKALFLAYVTGNLNFTGYDISSGDIVGRVIQPIDIREIDASGSFLPVDIGFNASLPVPPEAFQFRMETVVPTSSVMSSVGEWYDYKMKMFRSDYSDLVRGHLISEVHDFGTGVSYIMNTYFGNCTVAPIDGSGVDAQSNGPFVVIRDPKFFFDFNLPYTYLGIGEMRGVDVDIWQTKRDDWPPGAPTKSVWTWYWSTGKWVTIAGEDIQTRFPVAMTVETDVAMSVNNIYDFRTQSFDILGTSVESCFAYDRKKHYQFYLAGDFGDKVDQNPESFYYLATASLASYLDISPVRVANLEYIRNKTDVIVIFTMLDKAPVQGSVQMNKPELSLEDASKLFLAEVDAGKLIIAVFPDEDNPTGKPVMATATDASELTARLASCRYKPQDRSTPSDGLGAGAVAGIAVGMLLAGIILTIGALFIYQRVRGVSGPLPNVTFRAGMSNVNFEEK